METLEGASTGVDTLSKTHITSPVFNNIPISLKMWRPRDSPGIDAAKLGLNCRADAVERGVGGVVGLD